MTDDLRATYEQRRQECLVPCAAALEELLRRYLVGIGHVDRVGARAKGTDRFMQKAGKHGDDGSLKYTSPLSEIQDQIGARVVVFYASDVDIVSGVVGTYFSRIEERALIPESESEFGYVGKHFVLALPTDVVPEGKAGDAPRFFELQVKTLFQHAWSEASHDLAYKPPQPLTSDQKRRMAFTAAQAWGADRIFRELVEELNESR